jgi:hypothetical protein
LPLSSVSQASLSAEIFWLLSLKDQTFTGILALALTFLVLRAKTPAPVPTSGHRIALTSGLSYISYLTIKDELDAMVCFCSPSYLGS